jgi:hypothetical protein
MATEETADGDPLMPLLEDPNDFSLADLTPQMSAPTAQLAALYFGTAHGEIFECTLVALRENGALIILPEGALMSSELEEGARGEHVKPTY